MVKTPGRFLVALCAALAVFGGGACLGQGSATGSPEIAYVAARTVKGKLAFYDLWVMDANGANKVPLATVQMPTRLSSVCWSPDLEPTTTGYQGKIAVCQILPFQLWTMDVRITDASFSWGAKVLVAPTAAILAEMHNHFDPFACSWSPDGQWLTIQGDTYLDDAHTVYQAGTYITPAPPMGSSPIGTPQYLKAYKTPWWDPASTSTQARLVYGLSGDMVVQTYTAAAAAPWWNPAAPATVIVPGAYSGGDLRLSWGHGSAFPGNGIAYKGTTVTQKGATLTVLQIVDPNDTSYPPRSVVVPNSTGSSNPSWLANWASLITAAGEGIVKIDVAKGTRAVLAAADRTVTYLYPDCRR